MMGLPEKKNYESKCPIRENEREPGVVAGKAIRSRCRCGSCEGEREGRKES